MKLGGIAAAGATLVWLGCSGGPPAPEPAIRSPAELQLSRVETAFEAAFLRGLASYKVGDYRRARRELETVAAACPGAPIGGRAVLALAGLELDPRNPERDPEAARELARRYFHSPRKPAWTEPAMEALYLLALELGGPEAEGGEAGAAGEAAAPGEAAAAGESHGSRPDAASNGAGEDGTSAAGSRARSETAPEAGIEPAPEAAAAEAGDHGTAAGVPPVDLDSGGFRCEAGGPEHAVGPSHPPVLPDAPLAERLVEAQAERATLRRDVARLERRVAELLQELERIRTTLRP